MNTEDKIKNSLAELERQSKFAKDYRELMEALIQVSKVHRTYNLVFDDVKLPQQWFEKYPNLLKDLEENKLKDRLLGFNLKLPPW